EWRAATRAEGGRLRLDVHPHQRRRRFRVGNVSLKSQNPNTKPKSQSPSPNGTNHEGTEKALIALKFGICDLGFAAAPRSQHTAGQHHHAPARTAARRHWPDRTRRASTASADLR